MDFASVSISRRNRKIFSPDVLGHHVRVLIVSGVRRSRLGGDLRSLRDCARSAEPLDCSLGDSDADCNELGLRSHFGPSAILQPETGAGS